MPTPKDNANAKNDDKAVEVPSYLKFAGFDTTKGEEFGGASDILELEIGEAAGPLTYIGHRMFDPSGNGRQIAQHTARDGQSRIWRMPIAADFIRQVETANLAKDDTFAVKRIDDVIKKNGPGKGDPMQMFVLKVLSRAKS